MNFNSTESQIRIIIISSIIIFILFNFISSKTFMSGNLQIIFIIMFIILIITIIIYGLLYFTNRNIYKIIIVNLNLIILLIFYLGSILLTLKYDRKKYSLFEIIDDAINKIILFLIILVFVSYFFLY